MNPHSRALHRLVAVIALALFARTSIASASLQHASTAEAAPRAALDDDHQVHWQRSLEDALAIARAESRPLLVAVNMDGESASERIVRERYRDPKWVAMTRPFVCVVSSVFRHAPRDHDEQGRRIPCPRLGEVTCGEHIALEPVLYERFLQGERISPRHAVVTADGEKSFDLFLLFDLGDLDKKLAEASPKAPAPNLARPAAPLASDPSLLWRRPDDFVVLHDHASRSAVERVLASGADDAQWTAYFDALDRAHLAPDPEVLRIFIAQSEHLSDALLAGLPARATRSNANAANANAANTNGANTNGANTNGANTNGANTNGGNANGTATNGSGTTNGTASSTGAPITSGATIAELVRERFAAHPAALGAPGLGADARLLPLLAEADPTSLPTRTLLTSYVAVGDANEREYASHALKSMVDPSDYGRVETAVHDQGGGESLTHTLELARAVTRAFEADPKNPDALPSEADLEAQLAMLEGELARRPDEPALVAGYGRASLSLARKRMGTGGPAAQMLLEDAVRWLARASELAPKDVAILVDRMRTNYELGQFREQERLARTALGLCPPLPRAPSFGGAFPREAEIEKALAPYVEALHTPPERLEILRWLADASARLLNERTPGDPAEEALAIQRGARAFGSVAISPRSDESDWIGMASFYGAIGRWEDELACLQEGALRLPESTPLRTALHAALWRAGRIELAPAKAEWIQAAHPDSGACAWFSGYAHVLAAEDARRDEDCARAIAEYDRAQTGFEESLALAPEYQSTATYYLAMAWLGRGFAHLLEEHRAEAAECLVRAIETLPDIGDKRDGLDREPVDLLDGALEWRAIGASPVDADELCRRLVQADPENATWPRSIADSELREALRADGRDELAEGDRYLERSIRIARIARDVDDSEENRHALAQSCTVHAERLLTRGDLAAARPWAIEACAELSQPELASDASGEEVEAALKELRKALGAARPRFRPGR